MKRVPLDIYDDMPSGMAKYIRNYGWHFNKKAYKYAVDYMTWKNPKTNKEEAVQGFTKEEVDDILKEHDITLKNKIMYDYVFVATMCKADYPKAIHTTEALAHYIEETVDDIDASAETTFRRWVATMVGNGIPIDWDELC